VIPDEALSLLSRWLDSLLKSPQSGFGLELLIGLTISLSIARNATRTIMTALNVAFDDVEDRGIVRNHVAAFLVTALLTLLGIASIVLVAGVPALIGLVPLPPAMESTISLVRWPILLVIIVTAIALTYRFGPARRDPRWGWTSAGALFATFLWIAGSIGFSLYVENFANYDNTYSSIGAVVVLLLWFGLNAFAVLEWTKPRPPVRDGTRATVLPLVASPGQFLSLNDTRLMRTLPQLSNDILHKARQTRTRTEDASMKLR
jgi:membrane protein